MVLKIPPPICWLRQGYDADACWVSVANKLNEEKRKCEKLMFCTDITPSDAKLRFGILKRSYARLCSNFLEGCELDLVQWRHYDKFTKILYNKTPAPASDLVEELKTLRNRMEFRMDEISELLHLSLERNKKNTDQEESDTEETKEEPSFEFLNDLLYE